MSAADLTEFLLARIAEDEEVVRALRTRTAPRRYSRPWRAYLTTDEQGEDGITLSPARVLAECEAKRRIVDEHKREAGLGEGDYCDVCRDPGTWDYDLHGPETQLWPCRTMRALALPYADHPDYREEWRP